MIIITDEVYKVIDEYTNYLINERLTSNARAQQKRAEIIRALHKNLGGIVSYPLSPYKMLGRDFGYSLYVYKYPKSKTQWGFAHSVDEDNNVIVYMMKNMSLIRENKKDYPDRFREIIEYIEKNFDRKSK